MQPQTPPNPPAPRSGQTTADGAATDRELAIAARVERLAREVESLHGNLEHAQRLASLGTIAGIIAHEFNNILTPVMSYAQMALANPHDQQLLMKSAQRALDGAEKASQIAAAILEFARDEFATLDGGDGGTPSGGGLTRANAPRVAPKPDRVEVQAAVHGALACLAREPAKDGISLELDVPDRTFAAMRPVALQQVLLNLILNARRAMAGSRTGGTLTIRATVHRPRVAVAAGAGGGGGGVDDPARDTHAVERVPLVPGDAVAACSTWNTRADHRDSHSGHWLTISVRDTGHGMSGEQVARVFGAFVTGHGAAGVSARGTGLGLTVCQRLVEQAGGTIWCRSQVSVGTEFAIIVPATV